jgi:exopolysaccharide biosynthesis WecB/TagA/CpsF family protein
MNWLHHTGLPDRVYGPDLTLAVCRAAVEKNLSVYFHGSTSAGGEHLVRRLPTLVPGIHIAGTSPSSFGTSTPEQLEQLAATIRSTGASVCFVGLGCPRQEVFVYENAERLSMPCLAVGAAFDFHAGLAKEPPAWVQRAGLQWAQRLMRSPRRLWRRYVILNPRYAGRVVAQRLGRYASPGERPPPHIGFS